MARASAKLVRRFPADELTKPAKKRTKWFWIIRWTATDGDRTEATTIGFWSKDPTWFPARGVRVRMNRSEAEKALRAKLVECDKGKQDKPPATPWDEWSRAYINSTEDTVEDSTLNEIKTALRIFAETCHPTSPSKVDRAMVRRFVQAQLRSKGKGKRTKSSATVQKYLGYLRKAWNDVDELADRNPFALKVNKPLRKLKAPKKEWHFYTHDEMQSATKMLKADDRNLESNRRWACMIVVAHTSALRRSELLNLTWDDVDFDGQRLHVRAKEESDATWKWKPKDKDFRVVPMSTDAFLRLKQVERQSSDTNPYVFLSDKRFSQILARRAAERTKGRIWRPTRHVLNNLNRTWRSICERADVPRCEFHSLRKSCITNWLESGVPANRVRELAGHADIKTTIRYYARVDIEAALNQAREVADRLGTAAAG